MSLAALLVALVLTAAAGARAQPPSGAPPAVPGLCTGSGSAGIGCGYDATQLDAFGLTINPKRPVLDFEWCDAKCYEPAHYYDPDCEYCQFQLPNYSNMTYSVPKNAFAMPVQEAGGCYEQSTNQKVDDYMSLVGHTVGHDGWFHSWSKTTVHYYQMYYERDDSQSLQYKFLIWHQISLFPGASQPSLFFKIAENSLPSTYDNTTYGAFVQEWGTHYMDNAYMGGSALMTQYFHSCFLEQMGGSYVYKESSSSFFGIFNSADAKKAGFKKTDGKYKDLSSSSIKLIGGDSDKYGTLNWTNPLLEHQVDDWERSVKFNMMPLTYSFKPLHTLFSDATKARNMEHHLDLMGAHVAQSNQDLIDSLVPKDPHFKPSWCKYSPHPPMADRRLRGAADAEQAEGESGAARRELSLAACPALPSSGESARRVLQMREDERRRRLEATVADA